MKRREANKSSVLLFLFFLVSMSVLPSCQSDKGNRAFLIKTNVKLGVEVFLENHLNLIERKRVGLVTNPSGVTSQLESIIEVFYKNPALNLVALYGPEHGVRGNAQPGEYVPFYVDEKYKIPVFSLYGQSMKPDPGMLRNIDEYMRTFDTTEAGKIPDRSMIESIDVMIFDIQDVGTRIYTYIATMAYCLRACSENNIDFIVLDRPNPINGINMEGPILEYSESEDKDQSHNRSKYSSFVGLYPIPVRHGMTVGELALFYNDKFLKNKAKLKVIPMQGWQRKMWYDETFLPWVKPSPNMPTLQTAIVYPGQVFLEGTNVSEGRGTTTPFEVFGAPWIDGYELVKELNALALPGAWFREAWFTPTFSKYQWELCGGAQIHILDRNLYKPFESSLLIIQTIMKMYPDHFKFHADYFDTIIGTSKIRKAFEKGVGAKKIIESYSRQLASFSEQRKAYLLYGQE